jgi:hypothetical protein
MYSGVQKLPHSVTEGLMLYREINAVCSQTHTKHVYVLCGQNVEILSIKPDGMYSNH